MERSTKILWMLLAVCLCIDFILSIMTWNEIRSSVGWVKHIPQKTNFKLRHIVQYGPQTILLASALGRTFGFSVLKRTTIAIITITLIGVLSEIIQIFIPQRIFSFMDMFWDFVGASVGALIYLAYLKISKKL